MFAGAYIDDYPFKFWITQLGLQLRSLSPQYCLHLYLSPQDSGLNKA
jgi:hypothetical protein